ncbi:MAG: cache domain-containing protein [Elusimicrobiota bacterium]
MEGIKKLFWWKGFGIRNKILISIIFSITVIIAAILISVITSETRRILANKQESVKNIINSVDNAFNQQMMQMDSYGALLTRDRYLNETIRTTLFTGETQELIKHIVNLKADMKLYNLVVCVPEGKVLADAMLEMKYAEEAKIDFLFERGKKWRTISSLVLENEKFWMKACVPIRERTKLIAIVIMYNEIGKEFVDEIEEITGAKIALLKVTGENKGKVVISAIPKMEGIEIENDSIKKALSTDKTDYILNYVVGDKTNIVGVKPLKNLKNEVIGISMNIVNTTDIIAMRRDLAKAIGITAIFGLIISFLMAFFTAWVLSKPILKLVEGTQRLASGDFSYRPEKRL